MLATDLSRFAERRMLAAIAEGKLSHLAGAGRPLPPHPEEAFIDPGEAVGYRIMAEAGALPEEIALKRALDATRAAWAAETDPAEKKRKMAAIADLELRHAIAREARLKFLGRCGD